MKEIDDNEIRILGTDMARPPRGRRRWLLSAGVLAAVLVVVLLLWKGGRAAKADLWDGEAVVSASGPAAARAKGGGLTVVDTVVNDVPLTLFFPHRAHPSLLVGQPDPQDSTLLLAAMASDIRADNGGIVCDFVVGGTALARGERKEGYCLLLGDTLRIGHAHGGDRLRQALDEGGSFFRQYPLVAEGQAVPPKPKGKNHRRALCFIGGQVAVVASGDRESYHDFATALADLGVEEAIALVGSESLLVYRPDGGLPHSIGSTLDSPNANFLVWHR